MIIITTIVNSTTVGTAIAIATIALVEIEELPPEESADSKV